MIAKRILVQGFVFCFIAALVGCSDVVKVKGKVIFSDGEPVTHGCVTFESSDSNELALGMLDKNGNYSMGRNKDGDGIKPGTYKVWLTGTNITQTNLTASQSAMGMGQTMNSTTTVTVHPKFQRKDTSGLTFEAKRGGPTTFNFTVERPESDTVFKM